MQIFSIFLCQFNKLEYFCCANKKNESTNTINLNNKKWQK